MIEANISLMIALAFYLILLRKETRFRFMRAYLLISILASLVFPLIDTAFPAGESPLSIGQVIPTYWLPEVAVGSTGSQGEVPINFWRIIAITYAIGCCISLLFIGYQFVQLFDVIRKSTTYQVNHLRIAESTQDLPTFSFFNFIFIGRAHELTVEEKEQIIRHEVVHARQWHSFDIVLVNILSVAFWFNPFTRTYHKIFIQLHEFEADARAVESSDVNKYCSLLARVALQSADFRLANYFNNSLTVKRIEMMRTIKKNIKHWKLLAIALVVPMLFVFVACQDQMGNELTEITQNSNHALIVPAEIQDRYEQLKKENPAKNFSLLEMNETASEKLKDLERQYGLPTTMEVFTVHGDVVSRGFAGSSATGISIRPSGTIPEGQRTFAIIEFTQKAGKLSETAAGPDKVFTVVQQQPEFNGGFDAMVQFIKENLRYPAEARQQGIEGTVYASFIVEKDGSISDVTVVRGLSPACDEEVIRMMKLMPNWIPGRHNGEDVRVKFVLPIKFNMG